MRLLPIRLVARGLESRGRRRDVVKADSLYLEPGALSRVVEL